MHASQVSNPPPHLNNNTFHPAPVHVIAFLQFVATARQCREPGPWYPNAGSNSGSGEPFTRIYYPHMQNPLRLPILNRFAWSFWLAYVGGVPIHMLLFKGTWLAWSSCTASRPNQPYHASLPSRNSYLCTTLCRCPHMLRSLAPAPRSFRHTGQLSDDSARCLGLSAPGLIRGERGSSRTDSEAIFTPWNAVASATLCDGGPAYGVTVRLAESSFLNPVSYPREDYFRADVHR